MPAGERVYAIGDIHGRLDLFSALVAAIDADDAGRPGADTTVVLLGDLVDRGPESAGVVDAARAWQRLRKVRMILGNHEEMFLDSFERESVLRQFLRHGGRETVLSYPMLNARTFDSVGFTEAQAMIEAAVPHVDRNFLAGFEDLIRIGDYLFVHAGIEPGIPIDQQDGSATRWIREPFLSDASDHGCIVVHGHTITDEPEFRDNRIGIDTGAFVSGRLTALGLEGTERWLIETAEADGVISVSSRPA